MVRPSNSANQSNSNFQNLRVGTSNNNVMTRNVIRVDSAGNKYIQLPNGQLSQVVNVCIEMLYFINFIIILYN